MQPQGNNTREHTRPRRLQSNVRERERFSFRRLLADSQVRQQKKKKSLLLGLNPSVHSLDLMDVGHDMDLMPRATLTTNFPTRHFYPFKDGHDNHYVE